MSRDVTPVPGEEQQVAVTETRPDAPAQHRAKRSDRTRHERRLGLYLSAPSFLLMVLVTAYPLVYAVGLSLYRYRLTDPEGRELDRKSVV